MEVDTIAKNILKNVSTGEEVELQSFWQDKTTVIIFLRRWGCLFCHMWAKESIDCVDCRIIEQDIKLSDNCCRMTDYWMCRINESRTFELVPSVKGRTLTAFRLMLFVNAAHQMFMENRYHPAGLYPNTGTLEISTDFARFWIGKHLIVMADRFASEGWSFVYHKQVSNIAPILKRNDIKLIGVGVEELGAKEFSDLKLFDGDLFVDTEKKTYNGLGFKRFNLLSVLASLLWKDSRNAISKGRKMGLQGNLKGDGLQNGGALVVEKGGKVLRHFVQVGPSEQLSNEEILKLVGLESEIVNIPTESGDSAEKKDQKASGECNTEQCSVAAN